MPDGTVVGDALNVEFTEVSYLPIRWNNLPNFPYSNRKIVVYSFQDVHENRMEGQRNGI